MGDSLIMLDPHLQTHLEEAAYQLQRHGVIAFPTETVMGLGVAYDDEFAYHRLNNIKRRPEDKPYSLMLQNVNQIEMFALVDERSKKIIDAFLPGPLTILLPVKDTVPSWVTHGSSTIGIRVSSDIVTESLLSFVGKPLLVPSANRSGEKPCMNSEEVKQIFNDELDYIVEGEAGNGKPSTVLDLTQEEIRVIREGEITLQMINKVLSENKIRISIGSDHGGFQYKEMVIEHLTEKGYEVIDVGTNSEASCHYPVYGEAAARLVASNECAYGVVICTSGEGIMISANKIKGVRCGLAYNDEVAELMRKHNNANMIAFGAKFMSINEVIKRLDIFLNTEFEGGRHELRVDLISKLEK